MKVSTIVSYDVGPVIARITGGAAAGAICYFACIDVLFAFGVYSHYAVAQFTGLGAVVGILLGLVRPKPRSRVFLALACYCPPTALMVVTIGLTARQSRTFDSAYQMMGFLLSGYFFCMVSSCLTALAIMLPERVRISFGSDSKEERTA